MNNKKTYFLGLLAALGYSGQAMAAPIVVGAGVNMFGFEFDVATKLSDNIGLRVGISTGNSFKTSPYSKADGGAGKIILDSICGYECGSDSMLKQVNMDIQTYNFYLDYYPLGGGFRLTGGLLYGNNSTMNVTFSPEAIQNIYLGGNLHPASGIDSVDTTFHFKEYTPYFGIGWEGGFSGNSALNFFFNAGALLLIEPNISVKTTINGEEGAINASLQEAEKLQNLFSQWNVAVPHVNLGVSFRFN